MAFGIGVKARGDDARRLRDYWDRFGQFEQTPSMARLNYPPHITLAVYDRIDERQLRCTLTTVFAGHGALRLRFNKLAFFGAPKLVFWANPEPSEPLLRAHTAIHRFIEPALCQEYYRPGAWAPHCTIATEVTADNRAPAAALAAETIEPFDVIFDAADCVEFLPVRVIEECALTAPQ